jgi:hypothetical protein
MVTVRLSDADGGIPSLPSPTPTLKLVDEKSEEYILADGEPMFVSERSESPEQADVKALRRSGAFFAGNKKETSPPAGEEKQKESVDWADLEKKEDELPQDQSAEEVGPQAQSFFCLASPDSNAS